MILCNVPAGRIALDSASISVVRSADTTDDCPWGIARLKLDLGGMLNAPKECVVPNYLCAVMYSISYYVGSRAVTAVAR